MIVDRDCLEAVIKRLSHPGFYGVDTETTGLERKDRLFSIIVASVEESFYFNFNRKADHLGNRPESRFIIPSSFIEKLFPIFENKDSTYFLHNAKFDLGMLSKEGIEILGTVHCTEAIERVLQNNILGHKPYSLASCAARRGLAKDKSVDEYIRKHKLYTKVQVPGKEKLIEKLHFDLVPFDIITKYGCTDAEITLKLGLDQVEKLKAMDLAAAVNVPKIMPLVENERKLTKVCYRMEDTGIKIDRDYVTRALTHTQLEAKHAANEFRKMTGIEWEDSATTIKQAFEKVGIQLPLTRTGKPCTDKGVLDALENPLADKIREIRGKLKLCSTYYSSFLYFADDENILRANIRQGGTETSRFSYSDPNLQNLPKEDEEEDRLKPYLVRRSFVPLNPEWCFVPIDFKQQEFRMMLDYAGEKDLIAAIMSGLDVHDATAEVMGLVKEFGAKRARKMAKAINFGLLYGMGAAKLAKSLGVELEKAHELRNTYFEKLPGVRKLIRGVIKTGETRGYIRNWFGFRNHISSSEYAYILPNHLIQGGCAQVLRVAMVLIADYCREHRLRSSMLVQVHDELLFHVHRSELHHVPEFKRLMESVYKPRNGMRLECSVEHSWKSWGKFDMLAGAPEATPWEKSPRRASKSA